MTGISTSMNERLKATVTGIARRFYYASVPLGIVGVLCLVLPSSLPAFVGWLLIAWLAVEAAIKVVVSISEKAASR